MSSPTFADLGVPSNMVSSLAARRIDEPFPIQAATIPDGLAGRDLCGRAPTGSGKTIAFGIPMVVALTEGHAKPKRPRGLVLVPTRELASQVCLELQLLAKPKGPWVEAFYGGVGFDRQVKALRRGVDIVVACPGRLADLINQKLVMLDEVEFVVIDEADRMADMGFLPEVRRLLDQCNDERQTLLFSATLDGDVDVLIKKYQRNPAKHEFIADDEGGAMAEHLFWRVERLDRLKMAASVIKKLGPTVVFCRTKRGADRIATQLVAQGVRAAAIHGDRSQKQREKALLQFHKGQVEALVATDVAARGIHVDNVAGVIHYDPPGDPKDYVHRSGRTARAGQRGVVVSLVPGELRKAVADIQKELGHPVGLAPADVASLEFGTFTEKVAATPAPKVRSEHPERPERTRTERPERSRAEHSDRERPDRERPERTARPARSVSTAPAPRRPEPVRDERIPAAPAAKVDRTERGDERDVQDERSSTPARSFAGAAKPPLAEGQRRPSGAARRKAKRLAAAERTVLDSEGWSSEDLFDGRSARPTSDGPRPMRSKSGKAAASGRKRTGTKRGTGGGSSAAGARGTKPAGSRGPAKARTTGRAGAAPRGAGSGRSSSTRSSSGRSSSGPSRGAGGSRQAARSGSPSRSSRG